MQQDRTSLIKKSKTGTGKHTGNTKLSVLPGLFCVCGSCLIRICSYNKPQTRLKTKRRLVKQAAGKDIKPEKTTPVKVKQTITQRTAALGQRRFKRKAQKQTLKQSQKAAKATGAVQKTWCCQDYDRLACRTSGRYWPCGDSLPGIVRSCFYYIYPWHSTSLSWITLRILFRSSTSIRVVCGGISPSITSKTRPRFSTLSF